ncbi:MAG TPA: hypothetical protein VMF32_20975 [Xanthobacteraceae bacterium]|nr:hypothetical protein [Xanthobacteraceae bacterium]HUO00291.1 hypothetical protein [Bradyrhizobium sp.]
MAQPARAVKTGPRINTATKLVKIIEQLADYNRALADQNETLRINISELHRALTIQNQQLNQQHALFRAALTTLGAFRQCQACGELKPRDLFRALQRGGIARNCKACERRQEAALSDI